MAWQKPTPALVERFTACLPEDQGVERRKMFGYPCAFVNGNMFAGLHEQNLVLRLDQVGREHVIANHRAQPFVVMGKTMREYVVIGHAQARPASEVSALIAAALAYARTLPAKQPKRPPARKRAAAPA